MKNVHFAMVFNPI